MSKRNNEDGSSDSNKHKAQKIVSSGGAVFSSNFSTYGIAGNFGVQNNRISQMQVSGSGCTTVINGKTYTGRSISIINNRIIVDGVDITDGTGIVDLPADKKLFLNVVVEGKVDKLEGTFNDATFMEEVGTVNVENAHVIKIEKGVGGNVKSTSGDITVGGDVAHGVSSTSGNVEVHGDVKNGDAKSMSGNIGIEGKVGGNVNTMSGSIRYKK
jgi:hypothetical protein